MTGRRYLWRNAKFWILDATINLFMLIVVPLGLFLTKTASITISFGMIYIAIVYIVFVLEPFLSLHVKRGTLALIDVLQCATITRTIRTRHVERDTLVDWGSKNWRDRVTLFHYWIIWETSDRHMKYYVCDTMKPEENTKYKIVFLKRSKIVVSAEQIS